MLIPPGSLLFLCFLYFMWKHTKYAGKIRKQDHGGMKQLEAIERLNG